MPQHENRNFSEMHEYFLIKFCSFVQHIHATAHESVFTGRICPKGSSAGISFTHGSILGFFAPQERHVAPMTLIGSGMGVYGPQN